MSAASSSAASGAARLSLVDYVARAGGTHVIRRILIANNGIGAVKCIRSIRKWAYETFGNEREILFTVMATPDDLKANAEYIRMADNFVEVPGGSNNNNYANVRLIIETAESVGADAVWAGWGHASENPQLPRGLLAVQSRKIAFIGPPEKPMYALGDKIGSTIIAQSAGVPTIAWNGQDIKIDYEKEGLPDETYARANIKSVEEAVAAAERVGFPLMVKASEGGGGKGIRKVLELDQLPAAYRQVAGEVPGSPIFLMKLAPRSRHLEVQLLADSYGDAIAIFGRDCSVQRRHQKIIEEGPVLAAPPETWKKMERAAVKLAKTVGYVNAGTVEYLYLEDDGTFAFLELNPRLQVEHPVTEMISGVNLPAAQLHVAMGFPLWAIPDIRHLYGHGPLVDRNAPDAKINFETTERLPPRGHVIAARITAENPEAGFQPTSGSVTELNFRGSPNVWGYFSVDSSGRVHEFADSQFGHLFALGTTREDARHLMVMALKELSIRGDIRTTVEYLVQLMEVEDFVNNKINTAWLDARISSKMRHSKPDELLTAMVGAVWRAGSTFARRRADYISYLERGQHPPPALLSVEEHVELIYDSVKYSLHATLSGVNTITLATGGSWVQADFRELSDGGLLVSLGGRSHTVYAKEEPSGLRLVLDGATCLFTNEYDPTSLCAPMSGKLVRYLVEDGAEIKAGAPYAEVEVMKMYMSLTAPEAGKIEFIKPEGSTLEPGALLAKVALFDASGVRRAEPFKDTLPAYGPNSGALVSAISEGGSTTTLAAPTSAQADRFTRRWHTVARSALRTLSALMSGYVAPRDVFDAAWIDCDAAFAASDLALLEVEEVLSVLSSRMPATLVASLRVVVDAHRADLERDNSGVTDVTSPALNVSEMLVLLSAYEAGLPERERVAFSTLVRPLTELCERFREGIAGAGRNALFSLLNQYLDVERAFAEGRRPEDVVADLRKEAGTDKAALGRVFDLARAHDKLKQRNVLVLAVLTRVAEELELLRQKSALEKVKRRAEAAARGESSPLPTSSESPQDSRGAGRSGANTRRFSFVSQSTDSMSDDAGGLSLLDSRSGKLLGAAEDEVETLDITTPRASNGVVVRDGAPALHALHSIADLRGVEYAEVTLEVRQMLVQLAQVPAARRTAVSAQLAAMSSADAALTGERDDALRALVEDELPLLDILMTFFAHAKRELRHAAAEVYVRRLYRSYVISALEVFEDPCLRVRWVFGVSDDNASAPPQNQRFSMRADSVDGMPTTMPVGLPVGLLGLLSRADNASTLDLAGALDASSRGRVGVMVAFADLAAYKTHMPALVASLPRESTGGEPSNVMHLSLLRSPIADAEFSAAVSAVQKRPVSEEVKARGGVSSVADALADDKLETAVVDVLTATLKPLQDALTAAHVRRVTFNVTNPRDSSDATGNESVTPTKDAARAFVASIRAGKIPGRPRARTNPRALQGMPGSVFPWIYTFRATLGYNEDSFVRHIEPPASAALELKRLSNFRVRLMPTANRIVHVYSAETLTNDASDARQPGEKKRYFVRAIVRQMARVTSVNNAYEQYPGPERMFVECLDALNLAMGDALADTTLPVGNNHIFLNVIPVVVQSPEYVEQVIKLLAKRYGDRLRRLRVNQVEFRVLLASRPGAQPVPIRLVSSNPTGYVLRVDTYVEARNESTGEPFFTAIMPNPRALASRAEAAPSLGMLASLGLGSIGPGIGSFSRDGHSAQPGNRALLGLGDLDGKPVSTPYTVTSVFSQKRALAAAMSETVYVYDFLELFNRALSIEWSAFVKARKESGAPVQPPANFLSAVELVLKKKVKPEGQVSGTPNNANNWSSGAGSTSDTAAPTPMRRSASIFLDQFSNEMAPAPSASARSPGEERAVGFAPSTSPPSEATPTPSRRAAEGPADIDDYELVETTRAAGKNDIGMVVWKVTMFTPQYGEDAGGRDIIIIANDITHRAGSFGTSEDVLFALASARARELGLPRIYLAANSGARIGLSEEIKGLFKVAWNDPAEPAKGYKYLFLTADDYAAVCGGYADTLAGGTTDSLPVRCRREVMPDGEVRFVITDIIGKEKDLGVENLRGSGCIAGETSRAYNTSFTLTYVTGRSVGIGAYLVRLGQRCIQKTSKAPIILTGFEALNGLMGSKVYSSNEQLGGPRVMYANGVSHETVENDFEGVLSVLRWLAFVPRTKGASLPVIPVVRGDEVDRTVEWAPTLGCPPFDPRLLLTGGPDADGRHKAGLFDAGSFRETMGGWAKSVVTGRARLGGIPVGVITPELRVVTAVAPADPAAPTSQEMVVPQAGQVWFPDSAFKTAQAIRDFSGEDLPILIIANWRGFSGGQRDMFDEVLKFGSMIVDALVACTTPVFVYIPPGGELRGGAWVVVDPTINPAVMEMYADPTARGGVLEPAGTVTVLLPARNGGPVRILRRLDPALVRLEAEARAAPEKTPAAAAARGALKSREELLTGVFLQVAQNFADLHDTPGRMVAKGTINGVVPWARARSFFYWRLRRRLAEGALERRLRQAAPQLGAPQATTLLRRWYLEARAKGGNRPDGEGGASSWRNDGAVLQWLANESEDVSSRIAALRRESIAETVLGLGLEDPSAVITGVIALLKRLPADLKEGVHGMLRRQLLFSNDMFSSSLLPSGGGVLPSAAAAPTPLNVRAPWRPQGPGSADARSYDSETPHF